MPQFSRISFIALSYFSLMNASSFAQSGTWNLNNDGNWAVGTNWSSNPNFPNAIDDTATFTSFGTAGTRSITLNQDITLGSMLMSGTTNGYTLVNQATRKLIFESSSGSSSINNSSSTQALYIATPVQLNSSLLVSNGRFGSAISGNGGITFLTGLCGLEATNTYSGDTRVYGGTLSLTNNSSTIPAGTTLHIGDPSSSSGSATAVIDTALSNIGIDIANTSNNSILNIRADTTFTSLSGLGGRIMLLNNATTPIVNFTQNTNTTFTGSILQGAAVASFSPTTGARLVFNGTGILTLNGPASAFLSRFFIANGMVSAESNTALGALGAADGSSGTFVKATGTQGTLNLANNVTINKYLFLNGNGFNGMGALRSSSGNNILSNNVTIGWAGAPEVASNAKIQVESGSSLTINGQLLGSNMLTKSGSGTLTLTGTNTGYLGNVTIEGGDISISTNANLGLSSNNLTFNGGTLTTTASFSIPRPISLAGTGGTINTQANAINLTNNITGSGSLTKSGAGTLTLSGANSYLGLTNIKGGAISIGSDSSLGVGDLAFNGGTLITTAPIITARAIVLGGTGTVDTQANAVTLSGPMTGTGPFTKSGAGTLTLSGNNTYSGGTTVSGGILVGTTDSLQGAIAANNSVVEFAQSSEGTYSGIISGTGVLKKSDTGTLILSGANTYAGGTNINGGAISIGSDGNLGAGAGNLTFNGGTLITTASFSIPRAISLAGAGTVDTQANAVTLSGPMTDVGSFTKIGTGTLTLSGANTYSGGTNINGGGISIGSDGNLGAGNLTFNGGTLITTAPFSISRAISFAGAGTVDTQTNNVTLSGDMTGVGSFTKNGTGTLTLSGTNSYSGGTTVSTGVIIGTTDSLQGIITNNGILGFMQNFPGTYTGNMSGNGAVLIAGGGPVTFSGINSYTGGTMVQNSALIGNTNSLVGAIGIDSGSSITFDQPFDGTYAGSLSGTGSFTKSNSGILTLSGSNTIGTSTVSGGTLIVNGTLAGVGNLFVNAGATLGGTGTITKDATISGTLAPGNSIGTIYLVGNQTLASGSTLEYEFSPTTSDLVDVTGSFTVQPGSTLRLIPQGGTYVPGTDYVIVNATGGTTGQFTTVINPLPLLDPTIIYDPNQIILSLGSGFLPFTTLFSDGNAHAVADVLDNAPAPAGSDLDFVIDQLHMITSTSELEAALLQLQPSAFTSLAVAQQNNSLYVKNAISNRLDTQLHSCSRTCHPGTHIWLSPLLSITEQKNAYVSRADDTEPGFSATTPGIFVGIDQTKPGCLYLGGGLGYTFTDMQWKQNRGDANIHSAYASLYGRLENSRSYIQAALIGAYNIYDAERNIDFQDVQRTAFSNHQGIQGVIDARAALIFNFRNTIVSPFIDIDAVFSKEDSFQEHGADSLNLLVFEKNSNFLSSEFGLDISRCFYSKLETTPYVQIGIVRESRFSGQREEALLAGLPMTVYGLYPSRTLGALTVGVTSIVDQYEFLSLFYRGRYGDKFQDHSVSFEVSF